MDPVTRRSFFKQAGVTAAVVGAAAVVPTGVAGAAPRPKEEPKLTADELRGAEPIVAHVRDAASGEIALFVGERQVTIHDQHVASRLVRATH